MPAPPQSTTIELLHHKIHRIASMKDNIITDHCRKHLPHIENKTTQMVTFRLYDSVPQHLIRQWKEILQRETSRNGQDNHEIQKLRTIIDEYEDAGYGQCFLQNGQAADIVRNALLHFDKVRYDIISWCIMPNHVHVLLNMRENYSLSSVMHTWKSYTANEINKLLQRQGSVWMVEYFDRYIRDQHHLHTAINYIINNPVKAGLSTTPDQYQWSSAWHGT